MRKRSILKELAGDGIGNAHLFLGDIGNSLYIRRNRVCARIYELELFALCGEGGHLVYDPNLVRSLCREISTEKDLAKTEELLSLLRSAIAEDLEDARTRLAFLREKYGFAISDSKAAD